MNINVTFYLIAITSYIYYDKVCFFPPQAASEENWSGIEQKIKIIYLCFHYFLNSCINLLLFHRILWEIAKLFVNLKSKGKKTVQFKWRGHSRRSEQESIISCKKWRKKRVQDHKQTLKKTGLISCSINRTRAAIRSPVQIQCLDITKVLLLYFIQLGVMC